MAISDNEESKDQDKQNNKSVDHLSKICGLDIWSQVSAQTRNIKLWLPFLHEVQFQSFKALLAMQHKKNSMQMRNLRNHSLQKLDLF